MIRIRKILLVSFFLIFSSNVGLAQTDLTGRWKVQLECVPDYGGQVIESIWELEQRGEEVSGRITELASGKVTEFKDGSFRKRRHLEFKVNTQFSGKQAFIEIDGVVEDGVFDGWFDFKVDDSIEGVLEDNVKIVAFGKVVGKQIAATKNSITGKKQNRNAEGQSPEQGLGESEILFDGSNLDHFRGYKREKIGKGWSVENDVLHFDGTRSGDLITKREYGSFELTFDWKVSEGGNSGVMYRVTLGDRAASKSGIEYQILDNDNHKDGKNRETCAGSLYALYQPGDAVPNTPGEWNSSKIVIDGDNVQHWLNGEKVVDAEIGSEDWQQRLAKSKFAKWKKFGKSKRGHIAFQDHKAPVWYRNIRITAME